MARQVLFFALGVSAIRRHPGVDEKLEIFSEAVRRAGQSGAGRTGNNRFGKLLEEWEGSGWSAGANFTAIVVQIESDLITTIEQSHTSTQNNLNDRMNELACKSLLVEEAHSAAVKADQDANDAVVAELGEVKKLSKALTKLKNLDLIRQRSHDRKELSAYSFPGTFEIPSSFDCKFDDKVVTSDTNCDKSFGDFKDTAEADVQRVEDDLTLENKTWQGFAQEESALDGEQSTAENDAKAQYESWVTANLLSKEKWNVRELHICANSKDLQGNLINDGETYYGLESYTDGVLVGQKCEQNVDVPISFQRQHSDFCRIELRIDREKTRLETANESGGQPDQDYELVVLHTILCILKRLDIAESNLTSTDVNGLVSTCESSENHEQIDPYTYNSVAGLNCKKLVLHPQGVTNETAEWCFGSGSNPGVSSLEVSLDTFEKGTPEVPSCQDVWRETTEGTQETPTVEYSGKLHYRWRSSIHDTKPNRGDPFSPEGLQVDAWDQEEPIAIDGDDDDISYSGLGFLLVSKQQEYFAWAYNSNGDKCKWVDATASSATGWESKTSSDTSKKCAVPEVSEYLDQSSVNYRLEGGSRTHRRSEIITQCE
jgi:hypothetical protein